jgi:cell division ATP-binding protein FtsE
LIEFRRVSKIYQTGTHALRDVSFTIDNGEFVFIIGRSGAGKSTLIKLLTCEERPTSGQVLIDKFDVSRIKRRFVPYLRRNIGMVFQDFRLIDTKSIFQNVAFAMEIVGSSRKAIQRRVPIVLSIVGLRDKALARPGMLSGGEQQRVAIARAMVNNPMLILADEPTGNLDPANSEAIMALLEQINRSGTTVIICTHDRDLVDRMKKRVIEIDDGLLVRDDCQGSYAQANASCPAYKNPAAVAGEEQIQPEAVS